MKKEKLRINNELGDGVSIGSTFKEYSSKINNVTEQLRSIAQVANERKDNLEQQYDEVEKALKKRTIIDKKRAQKEAVEMLEDNL